jgi:hypothetical protein
VELLGGWSAGDDVTGSAQDAYYEAAGQVATVASARGWENDTLSSAVSQLDTALENTDDANEFWNYLYQSWPTTPWIGETVDGWSELGEAWTSYSGQSQGIFERATEITEAGLWIPDVEALAKAVAVGAVTGFAVSLVTDLSANVGATGGALIAGLWNWSNQRQSEGL